MKKRGIFQKSGSFSTIILCLYFSAGEIISQNPQGVLKKSIGIDAMDKDNTLASSIVKLLKIIIQNPDKNAQKWFLENLCW